MADHTELRCLRGHPARAGLGFAAGWPNARERMRRGFRLPLGPRPPPTEPPPTPIWPFPSGLTHRRARCPEFRARTLDPKVVRRFGFAFTPDSRSFITTDPDGFARRLGCPVGATNGNAARVGQQPLGRGAVTGWPLAGGRQRFGKSPHLGLDGTPLRSPVSTFPSSGAAASAFPAAADSSCACRF